MQMPEYLKKPTKKWLRELGREYQFESFHWRILFMAGEAWDRHDEARQLVEEQGSFIPDRFGQLRAHPGLAVMRDSKITFARLIREVGLDLEKNGNRPPGRY